MGGGLNQLHFVVPLHELCRQHCLKAGQSENIFSITGVDLNQLTFVLCITVDNYLIQYMFKSAWEE